MYKQGIKLFFLSSSLMSLIFTVESCKKNKTSKTDEPLKTDPIFYFDFNNGTSINKGVSKLPFTLMGQPKYATDHLGKPNSGLLFDGVDDYINIPHGNDIDFNEVTIASWIHPIAFNTYNNGTTSSKNYSGFVAKAPTYNLPTFPGFTTSANDANVRISAELTDNIRGECSLPANTILINNWYHISYVVGGGYYKIYINGILQKSIYFSTSAGIIKNKEPLTIGQVKWFPGDKPLISFFNGIIDDFRIYNKALSDNEITEIYNNSKP